MLKLILAVFIGVAGILVEPHAPQARATEHAAYGWCYYGSYSCYSTACSKARYLQGCGYCTKIADSGYCYKVYYH